VATLGYTTIGASNYGSGNFVMGGSYVATENGVINNVHVAIAAIGADVAIKVAISLTSGSKDPSGCALVGQAAGDASVSDDIQIAIPGGKTITNGTEYYICVVASSGDTKVKYTGGEGAGASYYGGAGTFGDKFQDPMSAGYSADVWRYSIWIDYTPSAGSDPITWTTKKSTTLVFS
jgi:hypothetical protein